MKKQLTIINGANVYAMNLLQNIRGFNNILMGDIYNSRKSFLYNLYKAKENDKNTTITHTNINSSSLLEFAIKDADTVVYFSHDYFSSVSDKNEQLIQTAEIAKAYNINKLIAITPVEFVNFQRGSIVESPIKDLNDANAKAMSIFDKTTIIKPDIIFGSNTYFVKFLMQCWAQSYTYFNSTDHLKHYKFNPIHWTDLNAVITAVIDDESNGFANKKYIAAGKDSVSFADIDNLVKQVYCSSGNFQEPNKILKSLIQSFQFFFHGNTHITNFDKMLSYLQSKEVQNEGYANICEVFNYKPKPFREYYSQKAEKFVKEELDSKIVQVTVSEKEVDNLTYPDFKSYWNISLN